MDSLNERRTVAADRIYGAIEDSAPYLFRRVSATPGLLTSSEPAARGIPYADGPPPLLPILLRAIADAVVADDPEIARAAVHAIRLALDEVRECGASEEFELVYEKLCQALRDGADPSFRAAVLTALGHLPREYAAAIIQRLRKDRFYVADESCFQAAVKTLLAFGVDAASAASDDLEGFLSDGNPGIRIAVCDALAQLGADAGGSVLKLTGLLDDLCVSVRIAACRALSEVGRHAAFHDLQRAVPTLVATLLKSNERETLREVALALQAIDQDGTLSAIATRGQPKAHQLLDVLRAIGEEVRTLRRAIDQATLRNIRARSESVVLYGHGEAPYVKGQQVHVLTKTQYEIVLRLIEAGPRGMSKSELERKHGGARKTLYHLAKTPPWEDAIKLPNKSYQGYRIV